MVGGLALFSAIGDPKFGHSGPINLSAIIVMFGCLPGLLLANWLPRGQQGAWIESPFFHVTNILAYALLVWLLLLVCRWFKKLPRENQ